MSIKVLSNVKICTCCESILFYEDQDVTKTSLDTGSITCPKCGTILPVAVNKQNRQTVLEDLGILGH